MKTQNVLPRRWSVLVVLSGVMTVALLTPEQQSAPAAAEKGPDLKSFMRKKLDASSLILEGLAVEDATLIRQGASTMLEMSKAEIWNVLLDEDFREFNRDFRSSMRKLEQAAADDKFDNALLQWIDAMKGCVECHKHVRDQRPKLK